MRHPSFDSLAVALGVYASAVVLVVTAEATGAGLLARTPLVAAVVALLVGFAVATTRTNLVVWMVENRLYAVLALAPTVVAFFIMFADVFSIVADTTVFDWLLDTLLSVLAGLLVYVVTMRRYAAHLREHERVLAEWTAEPDARYRWAVKGALLITGLVFVVGSFMTVFLFGAEVYFFAVFGGMFLGYAFVAGRTKRYTLFESGLVLEASGVVSGAFVPLGQLRSVACSERALTIYRGLPWPFPFRCSIGDLDDPSAIESTLREQLG